MAERTVGTVAVDERVPVLYDPDGPDARIERIHTASSDHLWGHPGPVLMDGRPVRVLFDPADPDRNLVDL